MNYRDSANERRQDYRIGLLEDKILELEKKVQALEDGPAPNSYGPECTCCRQHEGGE